MHAQATDQPRDGIVIASGYGLKLYVNRGHLTVHDGICANRQTRRYHRATSKLKRVIVIGHTGYITLDAMRWIRDVGAALVQLDADGTLIATTAPNGPNQAALRRAQALAATTPTGLEIARGILHAKVTGQASLLDELPDGPGRAPDMELALRQLRAATTTVDLVAAEAAAANAYWDAWSRLPLRFGMSEQTKVPDHWLTFGQRHSPLTRSPRMASNPANAILNYLYTLLEAETALACHAVGLDPGIGLFHADRRDRASLACDAMEVVRPTVDAYLLALLTQRTLARTDFIETRKGACRLTPRMATKLAATVARWREQIAPVIEAIAHTLSEQTPSPLTLTTPITRSNHRGGWDQRKPDRHRKPPLVGTPVLPTTCRDCGAELEDRRRRHCDECNKRRFAEHGYTAREKATDVLARLRSEQRDPAHGGSAGRQRGIKNAAHQQAVRAWKDDRPDPAIFEREILPGLRRAPITDLAAATGLSEHYCSLIRLGKRTPHPRHWDVLRTTGDRSSDELAG